MFNATSFTLSIPLLPVVTRRNTNRLHSFDIFVSKHLPTAMHLLCVLFLYTYIKFVYPGGRQDVVAANLALRGCLHLDSGVHAGSQSVSVYLRAAFSGKAKHETHKTNKGINLNKELRFQRRPLQVRHASVVALITIHRTSNVVFNNWEEC